MMALPPFPDLAVTLLPPLPPCPPTAVTFTAFAAAPVSPVFVADDCSTVAPEWPEPVNGLTCNTTDPPAPPLAEATAIESPPTALFAECAGGAESASRLMPPINPASTHNRDLRRIW